MHLGTAFEPYEQRTSSILRQAREEGGRPVSQHTMKTMRGGQSESQYGTVRTYATAIEGEDPEHGSEEEEQLPRKETEMSPEASHLPTTMQVMRADRSVLDSSRKRLKKRENLRTISS